MLQPEVPKTENPEIIQYIHQLKKILGARPKTQTAFKNQEFVEPTFQAPKGKKIEFIKVVKFIS